jgi:hypothetical protein
LNFYFPLLVEFFHAIILFHISVFLPFPLDVTLLNMVFQCFSICQEIFLFYWSRRIQNTSKFKGLKTRCKRCHDEELDKRFTTSLERVQMDFVWEIYCDPKFFPNREKMKDIGDKWKSHRRTHRSRTKWHVESYCARHYNPPFLDNPIAILFQEMEPPFLLLIVKETPSISLSFNLIFQILLVLSQQLQKEILRKGPF